MTTTTDTFTTIDRTTLQFVMNQTSEVYSTDPAVDGGRKEVVFIDTSVADYQILAASIRPGVEVELIGGGDDGLAQMAEWGKSSRLRCHPPDLARGTGCGADRHQHCDWLQPVDRDGPG